MPSPSVMPGTSVSAQEVLGDVALREHLRVVAGAVSLERPVEHPRIQKSGLALVGHHHGIVPTRIQILGETEVSYLETLSEAVLEQRCQGLFALRLSLVIVTRGVTPPAAFLDEARRTETPVVIAEPRSSRTIHLLHSVLDRLLAPTETRHGVLVDVHGIGMLITGPSGIGKSECSLSLLDRGHRFVADDRVVLKRTPWDGILGSAPPKLRHHLEVRGVGILNVRDLFGATAVRDEKRVGLVVELAKWSEDLEVDRLGIDDQSEAVLGISLPKLTIPVQPGRNMAVILEVAARNQLLKGAGIHGARAFIERLSQPD
ncbi:MAG: HPr(Ser) kinase/phosphatase [Myxococcota bacterium]